MADTTRPVISGDAIIGGATFREGDQQMGQWLIADVSLFDVHFAALDALRDRHNVALVYLCLGDAIALKASCVER